MTGLPADPPPKLPENPAPSIPVGEGGPREPVGQMGRRLVSLSGPAVTRQDAEAAKRTFTGVLQNISGALQELEEEPLWEGAESLSGETLKSAIQDKERKIVDLEEQLKAAKENLALAGKVLKGSYKQLSQQVLQIEAKLNVLRSSLDVYKTVDNPKVRAALELAEKTQEVCQKLSQMSRHQTAFLHPDTRKKYEEAVRDLKELRGRLAEMSVLKEQEATEKGDAAAAAAARICDEALDLLRGTTQRVITTLEEIPPPVVNPGLTLHPLRAIKKAQETFESERSRSVSDLGSLRGQPSESPTKVQRLTFSGRRIHAQEVHDLEESLRDLENKTTRLLDKVATGKATEADRQTIQELKGHLEAARQRYEDLSLTIGRKMASGQFIGRAVCLASITVSQNRIEAIEAAFSDAIEKISDRSTQILSSLSTALRSEGQKRAVAFYEACVTWEALRDQVEGLATENPLARAILEQKVKQLQDQLKSASGSVFALQSDREREEQESAMQIASGVATKDRRQAIPFLINAMTRLTVFAMSESDNPQEIQEATELRTAVDLCMRMSPEELEAVPKELLERYRKTTGPKKGERSWKEQIDATHAAIVDFGEQLAKTKKQLSLLGNYQSAEDQQAVLEAIDQLTVCEQKLESDEASLDPEIFGATKRSFDRLKEETPIELTPKERKLIESLPRLPKPPSSEEKKTIQLTLAKLMFQARHHPSEQVRKEKEEQAERLIGAMGFNAEYRSVLADLSSHKVMQEFQSTIPLELLNRPSGPLSPTRAKWVDSIFADPSRVWVQTMVTADVLKIPPEDRGTVDAYIRFKQDLAFLQRNAPTMLSRKEPLLEYAALLQAAYDRAHAYQEFHDVNPSDRNELEGFKEDVSKYAGRCAITDDKKKIARGALSAAIKDERKEEEGLRLALEGVRAREEGKEKKEKVEGEEGYFIGRIVEENEDKKLERMNEVVAPLLFEAISGEPQNPELVQALPKILLKFIKIDPNFLTRYPENIPLLARYVAERAGIRIPPSKDPLNDFMVALLFDATHNKPPKNPELVQALPVFLRMVTASGPDFLTRHPENLSLLAQYVANEVDTDAYQKFGGRMAVPRGEAQHAAEVFQRFMGEVPPYEPTQEWRDKANEFLKAATVLGNALGTSTLFVTAGSTSFLETAKERLSSAVRAYEEQEVLKNPEIVKAQRELQELALKLSPEALARNGDEDFPSLYTAYMEKSNSIRRFLEEHFPLDTRLVMNPQDFPYAGFLLTSRGLLEKRITGSSDKMVLASREAYFASGTGRVHFENGERFVEETLNRLQDLSPEAQRAELFDESIREGLRTTTGNLPPVLFDELEPKLFDSLMKKELSEIQRLADDLNEAESFDPVVFQEYTRRVTRLYLLSNIRYSGKYAQTIEESVLYLARHNPLLASGQMERLRNLPGFRQEDGEAMDHFLETTRPLQENLNHFPLRVKNATKKPQGYLEREMRKAFEGFLSNVVGKRQPLLDLVGDDTKSPDYKQSLAYRIASKQPSLVSQETLTQAQDKLRDAAERLRLLGENILGSLSPLTREKMNDPTANKAILFGEDGNLTPEKIQQLALDGKIDEILNLLSEAASLVKKDPNLFHQVELLYGQVAQWFGIPLTQVISSCPNPAVREKLTQLYDKIKSAAPK